MANLLCMKDLYKKIKLLSQKDLEEITNIIFVKDLLWQIKFWKQKDQSSK